jgi:hypothetical protein
MCPDGDLAAEVDEAGDRAQDGRLARPVGTDHRRPRAGFGLQRQVVHDFLVLVRRGHGGGGDLHHAVRAPRRNTIKKNGAPKNAVITPMGISAGATSVRPARSARIRNAAPNKIDSGTTTR